MEVAFSIILSNSNDSFLDQYNEKWILNDNRRRLAQLLDGHDVSQRFPKMALHQKKVMVIICRSECHIFLNPGEIITAETYYKQLNKMHGKLQRLRQQKWWFILLHDNSCPHVLQLTLQKLNDLSYEMLPHPLYSLNFSPTNYRFFKIAFIEFIVSRTPEIYSIEMFVSYWKKCIKSNDSYFDQ